ncbi:MAG: adenylosuccinate lyase [Desulfotomaculum sp.]|nr:adenylosuccinate lyase [Desulfotomaculum sp.]
MIERYTLPEMKQIWSEKNKFQKWLDVEIYACEALVEQGVIPTTALVVIKEKARFTVERILEIEATVQHDVIAFLTCVAEYVGDDSKYIHLGLTSSDVVDTAQSVRMKEAGEQILTRLKALHQVLLQQAKEHRFTIMIGRTHGIHAEPMTFGLKMLLWAAETERNIERLHQAIKTISVGKISGAVGTYANIGPEVEAHVCNRLNLTRATIATQVLQRDRHAEYMNTLAIIGCTLEKIATEIRALQRTDIREVEEFFAKGQKGSSAMPHKRNPIITERITGMARLLRGNALVAMENVALWHERDISHSSVERVIIPDSTTALDYMLKKMIDVISNLLVYPEKMKHNMARTKGLMFSQRTMLALVDKGITREQAYELVQRNAMECWRTGKEFKKLLAADQAVIKLLTVPELDQIFEYSYYLKHIDQIYARFGL